MPCRLNFEPSEAIALGAEVEAAFKPVAEAAQRESHSKAGKMSAEKRKGNARGISPSVQDESARTTAVAGYRQRHAPMGGLPEVPDGQPGGGP